MTTKTQFPEKITHCRLMIRSYNYDISDGAFQLYIVFAGVPHTKWQVSTN